MAIDQLLYFLLAAVILTIAPGPDILYLLAKSLADGAKSGVILAAGLCSGLFFHTALVAGGVAAVISSSPGIFAALKYGGAAYLFYLAWLSFRERGEVTIGCADRHASWSLYRRGVMMNVLNPKVILFFLAFLPQFIRGDSGDAVVQTMMLGAVFGLQAFIVFSAVACLAGQVRRRILATANIAGKMGLVQGVTLVCIAAALVVGA